MSLNIQPPDRNQAKVSQPKSWRDVYPIHPAAELFPLMSEHELRELGEDIRKNGLKDSITLCKWEGKLAVLDGRNRLDAIELVRGPIGDWLKEAEVFRASKGDPYDYAISTNIHRRHLTAEQKRELIAKVLKAKPEASDRQIAEQTKTSPTTVGKIRKKSEAIGDVSKLDTRTDTKGRKQPSAKPKKLAKPAAPPIIELDRSDYSEIPVSSAKPTSPAKPDPIGSPPVRYSEVPATSVPRLSPTAHFLVNDISRQLKEADPKLSAYERLQLFAKIRDLVDDNNIVEQALHLVEKMTPAQRRDFEAWLKTRGLIGVALDEITDDLSIPASLRRSREPAQAAE